jgi:single-strand DNA-binding protein
MANETVVAVVGNLTSDPEIKYLPTGAGVASFEQLPAPESKETGGASWVSRT